MDAIGVIPARYGSTRFPGKPLALIAGRPLLAHVIEGARTAKSLRAVLVATDDERIAQLAESEGCRAVMTVSDLPTGSDRVWAALGAAGLTKTDVVVNIQGDEPLISAEPLDALVAAFAAKPETEMATLGREFDLTIEAGREALLSSATAKIAIDQADRALYFSRLPIPFSRVTLASPEPSWEEKTEWLRRCCLKHVGIYAYRPRFLERFCAAPPSALETFEGLEQLRALALGGRIQVVRTRHESWGVDSPSDVEKIESLLKGR